MLNISKMVQDSVIVTTADWSRIWSIEWCHFQWRWM